MRKATIYQMPVMNLPHVDVQGQIVVVYSLEDRLFRAFANVQGRQLLLPTGDLTQPEALDRAGLNWCRKYYQFIVNKPTAELEIPLNLVMGRKYVRAQPVQPEHDRTDQIVFHSTHIGVYEEVDRTKGGLN